MPERAVRTSDGYTFREVRPGVWGDGDITYNIGESMEMGGAVPMFYPEADDHILTEEGGESTIPPEIVEEMVRAGELSAHKETVAEGASLRYEAMPFLVGRVAKRNPQ